jgi:hypothetical protein
MISTINGKFNKNLNVSAANQKEGANILHSKKPSFNINDS